MNEQKTLETKALHGMAWKFAEKVGAQVMQFVIQIVLARLLLPAEYGLVGLLTIFISLCDVVILQGLTTALIQKKNADDTDFSSVFFANIVISLCLYGVLFFSAPFVAAFYNEPQLTLIMRVLSLNVIIGAFPAVHNAILSRNLDFKKSFYRNISNVTVQGVTGIAAALYGLGAWSLVISKLSGMAVGALVLMVSVKWKPKKVFSFARVKSLFSFSSKVLVTNLLNTFFNNIHSLIIGRFYTPTDVGHYQRGQQIPQMVMSSLDGSMTEVLYPTFSKVQHDLVVLKASLRKSVRTSMYIVLPVLMGMMAVAEPLTMVLLTEKWLPSVPFMQLSCVVCMFWPLSHRTHALNALGKSNVTMMLSFIGKGITLLLICVCIPYGIYAILLGTIAASSISLFLTSYFVKKHIGYSGKELAADVLPSLCISCVMGAAVYAVSLIGLQDIVALAIQIPLGMALYIALSYVFRLKAFSAILSIVSSMIKKKKA